MFWTIFLTHLLLLVLVGWQNRDVNDFDGTAYMRIAHYYASGNTTLMVSGYWGPLLSWLMVPWLWLGLGPFDASRIATGISAVVFQLGCISVFRSFGVPAYWALLAMAVTALASVSWSVMWVSPDLLVSGLMCLAISRLIDSSWLTKWHAALSAGLICGLAYLAKAVALPVLLVVCCGFAGVYVWTHAAPVGRVLQRLSLTLLAFCLVAGPWIIVLSLKYEKPTFSETARIAHSVIGPRDVDRYHPIGRITYRPQPGRISAWEDPSEMPYAYWSPFESRAYAAHQIKHIGMNMWTIWRCLLELDIFSIGLLSGITAFFSLAGRWRQTLRQEKWRWSLLPSLCLVGIYLPVYADAPRYFYAVLPLFLVMVWGCCLRATDRWPSYCRALNRAIFALVIVSFGMPALCRLPGAVKGYPTKQLEDARLLARKLREAGWSKPLIGTPNNLAIDWVALFTDRPWYGYASTPEACRETGAGLVVIERGSVKARTFASQPGFENLDRALFSTPAEAAGFPVQLFSIGSP